ncbi:DegT/DnrJ/EryC1/StrS family aminotransferase [Pseudofrankia asymbiotica]|uniref:Glutamine--scyllo-inositol aminotransferase n=1 Tax=Pseudofrankia asymbiotica TaxID=1834516 RepID=A0A1V2I929_9ACTN|nr:DegT/DnrJ/EryC1/StrS family aminotransferase [Pseudofrankia asymbiotica]ONH28982.1 glutamine--scyllo-inositol aminotransferase [Pseudofrankia asymbiotica]
MSPDQTAVAVPAMLPVMRPWLGDAEAAAAAAAVASGWVAQGPRVAEFELALAARLGAPHAVVVSSCTAALHLALVLAEVGPGDEVVVPSLSFIATANAARYVGARPVFADVDPVTQNVTVETVQAAITPATRAVIAVDQGGMPADIEPLRVLCHDRGLVLVQDSACAIGSTYRGRPVGGDAELSAYSFHPRKLLTTGEGGALAISDPDQAARARRLREHGMSVSAADRHSSGRTVIEDYAETGFNYRMTDVQAAIGLVQLGRLDEMIGRRRFLAARYQAALAGVPGLRVCADPPYGTTNYQSFWVELADEFPLTRNELLEWLLRDGISARRGIMAAHREPAYAAGGPFDLPVTDRLTTRTVILPLFHQMTEDDVDRVVSSVRSAAAVPGRGAA